MPIVELSHAGVRVLGQETMRHSCTEVLGPVATGEDPDAGTGRAAT